MQTYKYEAFISYSRKDSAWADKLFAALENPNFRIFRDTQHLNAGAEWDPQLRAALKESRCLLVLWSSNADKSQWVWEEIKAFKSEGRGAPIIVTLDIDFIVEAAVQAISDLKDAGVYAAGADQVPVELWNKVINKIRKVIYLRKGSKPVTRAVFTLNTARLPKLSDDKRLPQSLIDQTATRYGPRFADWKPFGRTDNIETMLDDLLYGDVNLQVQAGGFAFHWEDIDWMNKDSALWLPDMNNGQFVDANVAATATEIDKLKSGPAVVILDPLALADFEVRERFNRSYDNCVDNVESLVMVLHHYDIERELSFLRSQLKVAHRFYNSYFDLKMMSPLQSADCFASTIDKLEIKRNLRYSLRKQVRIFSDKEKNANTILSLQQ